MKLLANILSVLLHPLWMIGYGVLISLENTILMAYPYETKKEILFNTVLFTALLPFSIFYLMHKLGWISDASISNKSQRTIPYLIYLLLMAICVWNLFHLMAPFWLLTAIVGSMVSILLAILINLVWKISVHAIAMGGFTAGVMGVSFLNHINPYLLIMGLILLGGFLCMARLILKRHTLGQVLAGYAMGFICILPAILYNEILFNLIFI